MHVGTSGKAKLTVGAALRADDDKNNICDGDEDDESGGFDDNDFPPELHNVTDMADISV